MHVIRIICSSFHCGSILKVLIISRQFWLLFYIGVSYLEGRTFTEIVLKQGAEEDILTLEGGINRRPEKIAL